MDGEQVVAPGHRPRKQLWRLLPARGLVGGPPGAWVSLSYANGCCEDNFKSLIPFQFLF